MLGIKYPILQGGMAWVADPNLAAAVSNAGGLGTLTGTLCNPKELSGKIRELKSLTDKPFAVNFTPGCESLEGNLDVCIQEKVSAVTFGRGRHTTDLVTKKLRPHGILSITNVGSVRQAIRVEEEGADAIIVSGYDAGGHVGYIGTLPLVTQVTIRVGIPVIAAGGFADGRGFAAALCLGADGMQMGTRFVCTQESPAHINVKRKMLAATEEDTIVTGHITGVRARCLKNELTKAFEDLEQRKMPLEDFHKLGMGKARSAYVEGDADMGSIGCGQIVGLIDDIPTCKDLIERIVAQAEEVMKRVKTQIHAF